MPPEERRRDGDRQWREDLEDHDRYPFAHQAMINRLLLENVTLRERLENRLRSLENWRWWVIGIGALLVFEIPLAIGIAFALKK